MQEYSPAGIAEVLFMRDARDALQKELRAEYACPLICLSMNIPGPNKRDRLIDRAFAEGRERIADALACLHVPIRCVREEQFPAGSYCVWAVAGEAQFLKERMQAIEEADALGRLLDIDVLDPEGTKLSRGTSRRCLLCEKDTFVCARSRAHSWQALSERAHAIIRDYFDEKYALNLGMLAQRALLHEAAVTPKPGLVDCENSGAHGDMDLFTLLDSACVLRPCFDRCALEGIRHRGDCRGAYAAICDIGIRGEAEMRAFCRTNTHKGALFALGILCCAGGMAGEGAHRGQVLTLAARIAGHSLAHFSTLRPEAACTGGERQYLESGLRGARGEAAAGFPTAVRGLEVLTEARSRGMGENDAALQALLWLIAATEDSNILRRGGEEALRVARGAAERLLHEGYTRKDMEALNRRFVDMHISPGGSADLLAVALFLESFPDEGNQGLGIRN